MVEIRVGDRVWRYRRTDFASYTDAGFKLWERGFEARIGEYQTGKAAVNPYRSRFARGCWLAGYDNAKSQERLHG